MTSPEISAQAQDPLDDYQLSKERLEDMYRSMLLARRLNERMQTLNRQGRAPFVITGTGQEAAQVGAAMSLQPGVDYLAPYYRDLAMNLVLGMTAREAILDTVVMSALGVFAIALFIGALVQRIAGL